MPLVVDAEECERVVISGYTIHDGVFAVISVPDLLAIAMFPQSISTPPSNIVTRTDQDTQGTGKGSGLRQQGLSLWPRRTICSNPRRQ